MLAPLVLASASPRRTELLAAAGWDHAVAPTDVDETLPPGADAGEACRRLAEAKARAGAAGRVEGTVLGADTLVVLDGAALGKPEDQAVARRMLASLSGRAHQVISAVALLHVPSGRLVSGLAVSDVRFDALDEVVLQGYLDGDEWRDKAGAYAIQGDAAAFAHLAGGELDTVIGLPMTLVRDLARELETSLCAA
jgi:septum formation protein